jgi:diadenosine tetraphosphate (Ap4A) HIT family hydrolase
MRRWIVVLALGAAFALGSEMDRCACEAPGAEAPAALRCSLCRLAEKRPAGEPFFFLKDNSPLKPDMWLILPHSHAADGPTPLSKLTQEERTKFWTAAIARARALWGVHWGLALNGDEVRSQCHMHVHMGRLLDGVEQGQPLVVGGPAEIPVPKDGSGLWIHAAGDKLHVHVGEQGTEGVLER